MQELSDERKKFLAEKKKRLEALKKEKPRLDRIEMQMTILSYDMDRCPKCKTLQNISAVDIQKIQKKGRYLRIQTTCSPGCVRFNMWEEYRILTEEQIKKMTKKAEKK